MKAAKKPKKTFADIDAARKRYNPEVEGYGDPQQWNEAFFDRMGFEEAQKIISDQEKTPRDILGVGRHATWEEITKAYRKQAMACHPDRVAITGMTVEEATEAFKKLGAAYAVLAREFGK